MITILLGLLLAGPAQAFDVCNIYREYCPGYTNTVTSGTSYPSLSDTFNVNPASIPITITPVGVEAIMSTKGTDSGNTINFTLVRGFEKLGIGASNNSDNTFYSYNLVQALQETPFKDSINNFVASNAVGSSFNLGAAFAPFKGKILNMVSIPSFGASLRFNRATNHWDPQLGASLNASIFNVGASFRSSKGGMSGVVPPLTTTNFTVGTILGVLAAEYSVFYVKTSNPALRNLPVYNRPTHILTGSLNFSRIHGTLAYRKAYNAQGSPISLMLYAAQYELLKRLSLAVQRNYLPGATSVSAQLLF